MCVCVSVCICVCVCVHVIFKLTIVFFTSTVWELSGPDQELSYISQSCKPYSTHKVCYTHAHTNFNQSSHSPQHKVVHIGLPVEWQLSYIKPPMTDNEAIGLLCVIDKMFSTYFCIFVCYWNTCMYCVIIRRVAKMATDLLGGWFIWFLGPTPSWGLLSFCVAIKTRFVLYIRTSYV